METFRLIGVSAGSMTLKITYLGRPDWTSTLMVEPGAVMHLRRCRPSVLMEENILVEGTLILDANARALNQQKTAPNITSVVSADQIGSFPDRNAAETTQRVAGVSITKDQGEGRYVSVRGTEARLNAMMIDGERIPSPDPLLRQVAVDVVPSELLQTIEVSKTLTPDMDADSIGGSVNLVTRQAPDKAHLLASAGGGFNAMLSNWSQSNAAATAGRRFSGGRLGVIGSFSESTDEAREPGCRSHLYTGARIERTQPAVLPGGPASDRVQRGARRAAERLVDVHRARHFQPVHRRPRKPAACPLGRRQQPDRSRASRSNPRRAHRVARRDWQSPRGYRIHAGIPPQRRLLDQFDPLTMTTTFRQSRVTFAPNVTPTSIDPDNIQANPQNEDVNAYNFQQQIRATNYAKDRDVVAYANFRRPVHTGTSSGAFLKVGAKFRAKQKGRDRSESTYASSRPLAMINFLETGFGSLPAYLDGRYNLKPYLSQSLSATIPNVAR